MITVGLDVSLAQLCKIATCFNRSSGVAFKYRGNHPVFHHGLKPGVAAFERWGNTYYPVFTNSLGFVDSRVRTIPSESTRYRVVIIGGSFVEGVGITYQKTIAGIVGRELSHQNIEVLNASVSSYAPAVYFSKIKCYLEEVSLQFDHLIVFIDIGDIFNEAKWYTTDEQGQITTIMLGDADRKPPFRRRFTFAARENSLFIRLGYLVRDHIVVFLRSFAKKPTTLADELQTVDEELWIKKTTNLIDTSWLFDETPPSWSSLGIARARQNKDRLKQLLDRYCIELTVVVYPWIENIARHDLPSKQSEMWRQWAEENGAGFIDLFPIFILDKKPFDVLRSYFIPCDIHWNEKAMGWSQSRS